MSSYDSHSKHIILIAIIHILCYIFIILGPTTTGALIMASNESLAVYNLFMVSFYFLMIIFAGLMIGGVIKQRRVLVAPWLVMASLGLVAMIVIFILNIFVEMDILIYLGHYLETIGMEILAIYPTYTYYMKLRRKSLKQDEVVETKTKSANHMLV